MDQLDRARKRRGRRAGGAGRGGGRRLSPQMGRAADPVGRAETRRRDERGGDRRLPKRQGRQMVASRRGGVRRRTSATLQGHRTEESPGRKKGFSPLGAQA